MSESESKVEEEVESADGKGESTEGIQVASENESNQPPTQQSNTSVVDEGSPAEDSTKDETAIKDDATVASDEATKGDENAAGIEEDKPTEEQNTNDSSKTGSKSSETGEIDDTSEPVETNETKEHNDTGETDAGGDTGKTDAGGDTGKTNTGGDTGETDTGGNTGETDAGGDTGETDAGGNTGETDAGGNTGETDAGGDTGETDAGGDTGETDAGGDTGDTGETDAGGDTGDTGENKISIGDVTDKVTEGQQQNATEQSVEQTQEAAEKPVITVATEGEDDEEEVQVFEYSYDDMKSTPEFVNVPTTDMLSLYHSFGYECQKRSNLVVLAKDMVTYAAGNLVILLNLKSQEQMCFRSLGGGGIGAIAVHPSQEFFAVGEKGVQPVIAIYTYPELKLHRILRGGTEEAYSHMDFSPGDGKLLASVGGNPDYMLTVWDWAIEKIVLRSKAFSQDIYRVTFSPENPSQLTTSGTGHIRFWKMATTFTGLKLQGYLGKFGRIEISDISAYVELPDGKVLSGTEWGNMLLWDGGFIKVEISGKGKKCHNGMIEAIYLDEGELITAGVDGFVRVWDFETIDSADISEENTTFEMEPLTEIKIGNDVSLKSLARSVDPDTPTLWYAQDAGGAIWKIDIVVSHTRKAPEKLISFHSGEITGLMCSPIAHQAASISQNGSIRVYDLQTKQVLCHSQHPSGGSSLLWVPETIDPSATTLIAGHTDGVVRVVRLEERVGPQSARKRGQKYQLTLIHACKPHTQAVTSLAIDPEGKLLASGSTDKTVFFLSIEDEYKPIGFVHVPAPVTTIKWSPNTKSSYRLLVCCDDGSMMEVEGPAHGAHDTSKTFHLDNLNYTSSKFTSIKDKLRTEEEEARLAAERARKQKEKDERKQKRKELLGDDYVSDEEQDEEETKEDDEEGDKDEQAIEEVEKPKGPSSILSAFYCQDDDHQYWVSMSGYDAGYLYRCSLEESNQDCEPYEAPHTIPVPPINGNDLPLHSLTFSSSGEYLLTGTSSGAVRIHPLSQPYSLDDLSSYWALTMHDNHYGAVTHLVTTFDDRYVLSGGADGNVFVYEAELPTASERAEAPDEMKVPAQSGESANDIEDAEHYSIEDAKQKAEHDRMMKLAEQKKQHVRRQIASLRRTFTKLQQRGAKLPQHLQLEKAEFVMDPNMEQQLRQQADEKVELVRKEMAWESEKHRIALRKLQMRYKDMVDCEHITVWSTDGEDCVSSFRVSRLSQVFLDYMEKLELRPQTSLQTPMTVAGKRSKRDHPTAMERRKSLRAGVAVDEDDGEGEDGETEDEMEERKISKQEARRLKKEQRKKEWSELYANKPDEKYVDPEDQKTLHEAKENMGDYKLKTASDYVVPQHLRVSTEKKRAQLLVHRKQIFDTKKEYNQKLLALRDWKLETVEKICELIKRLEALQSQLPRNLHKPLPPVPEIRPEEVPEKKLQYTKESLLQFKVEKEAREEAERQAAAGLGDGGFFGGFGGGGNEEGDKEQNSDSGERAEDDETEDTTQEQKEETGTEGLTAGEVDQSTGVRAPSPVAGKDEEEKLTPLQALKKQEQQVRCLFERDCLLSEVKALEEDFNEAVRRLHHTKSHLDISMMSAELKHITQFEELQLLKEFGKRETTFTTRYRAKKKERKEMEQKVEDIQRSVHDKEKSLGKLVEQGKALEHTFVEAVGENNKFKEFLMKVYRKKIKRAKRKLEEQKKEGEEGEDAESEDESDSELSSSEEESEDEEELDDSICPAGCDQSLFNLACEMREKRMDIEEGIAEEKKALEMQRKEFESTKKKAKTIESHVKTALNELQAFQLKKQQRLNELDQVVVLSLHQILHHGSDGEAPTSIAPCLVFPAAALFHLGKRIGELSLEKQQEKKKYKDLRQKHVKLIREKKEMQAKIGVLEDKANEAMMLKFGRVVDLDRLEGLSVNHIVEELSDKLRGVERKREQEVATIERQIDKERHKLAAVTREHTKLLRTIEQLRKNKEELEERLNARQKSMSKEVAGGDIHLDSEERQRLLQLVRLQTSEIDALKEEIQLLLRKGGHILPPTQPPVVATPQGAL